MHPKFGLYVKRETKFGTIMNILRSVAGYTRKDQTGGI